MIVTSTAKVWQDPQAWHFAMPLRLGDNESAVALFAPKGTASAREALEYFANLLQGIAAQCEDSAIELLEAAHPEAPTRKREPRRVRKPPARLA